MTLTQIAILTKQTITLTIIAAVVGIISFIGYKIWYAYYLANLPPVEEKPDLKFGALPPLDFPKGLVSSSNFSYSIDTSTGNLPKVGVDSGFEKIIKVYFVTKTFATLLSAERSQDLAEKFGILNPPQILSETNYLFGDDKKSLNINLDTGNFLYKNDSTPSAQAGLDYDTKLVNDFTRNLQTLGVFREDLRGRNKVILLRQDGNRLIPTQLKSEAPAAQISLWSQALDKREIFTPEFDTSLVNAIVYKSADDLKNYLSLQFTYYPIDATTFATYPIKTTEVAFEDLKGGKGVVVIEPQKPQVSITSIYLGYFLSENYSPYLQPIFIFEGPQFIAYVSAISSEFISGSP